MNTIKKKSKKTTKDKQLWLNKLGQKVKEIRQNAEMSQADLAYSIQMDAQNISRIERGLVSPSAYSVKVICDSIGISISEFYSSIDK